MVCCAFKALRAWIAFTFLSAWNCLHILLWSLTSTTHFHPFVCYLKHKLRFCGKIPADHQFLMLVCCRVSCLRLSRTTGDRQSLWKSKRWSGQTSPCRAYMRTHRAPEAERLTQSRTVQIKCTDVVRAVSVLTHKCAVSSLRIGLLLGGELSITLIVKHKNIVYTLWNRDKCVAHRILLFVFAFIKPRLLFLQRYNEEPWLWTDLVSWVCN